MALQNGVDDEDWNNWGNPSDYNGKSDTSIKTEIKRLSPNKENKFNDDTKRSTYKSNGDTDRRPYSDRENGKREDNGERRVEKGLERRPYSGRDADNDTKVEHRDYAPKVTDRNDYNSKRTENGGEDRRAPSKDNDFSNNFKEKLNVSDSNQSRPFRGNREDENNENSSELPPVAKRATYLPNDDEEDYELHVNSGINFDNYEKIPVEVTGEKIPKPITKFSEFAMPDFLKKNIECMKYTKLTPVQKYAVPIIDAGRDLMACAQTGSGKTVAFLLPIIASLHKNKIEAEMSTAQIAFPRALIMSPTRELCRQIFTAARQLCRGSDLRCAYIYGGIEMNRSRKNLQESGCDILVATPGRLIHFLELVWISLRYLRYFVLDEGDRMLDKDGFFESVNKISKEANMMGEDRNIQISMFSATFPSEIQNLAKNILKDYLFLAVGVIGSANSDVKQEIIRAEQTDKMNLAIEYIKSIPHEKTLVFVQSKRMADFFGIKLDLLGFKATTIHGDREQEQREQALNDFKSGRVTFMVATNVAARGLDIPMVDTVINIDMPDDIDTYVHRIGRTGRCGNVGRAVSFFDENNDIALAGPLISRLKEAHQECPAWLTALSDGTGNRRQPTFAKDNRRDMKVSKFVDTPNNSFMKGTNADYDDDNWNK